MSARFEELDWRVTPMGEISLRRRWDPVVEVDVYEVKLNDEFLMSSLFTVAERQLAHLALAEVEGDDLNVLVGGLGLGYTARAALEDPRVTMLTVIEAIEPVIEWHTRNLLPDAAGLAEDPRCRLVLGDFFGVVAGGDLTKYDVILLDIDHTPHHVLHPSHVDFYTIEGLKRLDPMLVDNGVFAMWSDDPPDAGFEADLAHVFSPVRSEVITFRNPLTGGESASTVYVARTSVAGRSGLRSGRSPSRC